MKLHRQSLMTAALVGASTAALVGCNSTPPQTQQQMPTQVQGQQVRIPTTTAEVPGPAAGNTMTKEYVQMVGRMAYMWGWPLVNVANRSAAFSKAAEPGLLGGVVPFCIQPDCDADWLHQSG